MIRGTDPHQPMLINIIITALDFSSRAEKSSLSSLSSGCDWLVTLWKDVGGNGANVTCRPTPSVHSFIWVSFFLSVPLNAELLSMWGVALHFPMYPFITQGLSISVEKRWHYCYPVYYKFSYKKLITYNMSMIDRK